MRYEEGSFDGAGGLRLFERRWLPEGAPRATVAIVHGYAEHSGRYAHAGEALAARGYAVHAFDLRGHGLSPGDRALVTSFGAYLDDVRSFTRRLRDRDDAGDLPFVLGHSMGGTIVALWLCVDRPAVAGAILSGAGLPDGGAPRAVGGIMDVVGRTFPRLPLIKLAASDVSRDPAVVKAYEDDPLVFHGRMRAGLLAAAVRAGRRIERDTASVTAPLLVLHGSDDALTKPEGSQRFYERVASADRALKIYAGLHHEILNEPERDLVIADIGEWLDKRTLPEIERN